MLVALAVLLAQLQPLPPSLIALDSEEGQRLLVESNARRAYFPLAAQFLTQRSTSFCGVASAVMALNALPLQAPVAAQWAPFRAFTEDNVFNEEARRALTPEKVSRGGLTLDTLVFLLRSNGAEARPVFASASSLEAFRAQASAALAQKDKFVLVDFLRSELGQDTGAHWSPLAAYHAGADRFLMLDVARFRYAPSWIPAADLFRALDTGDLDSGKSRGWVEVSLPAGAPPRAEIPKVKSRLLLLASGAGGVLFALGAAAGALLMRWRSRRRQAG